MKNRLLAAITTAFLLLAVLLPPLARAQSANQQLAAASVVETIKKRGSIRVGMSTFVPWAMRDKNGEYHLIEINPRFPAWVYLSAGAGMNLPYAAVDLALGRKPSIASEYTVGTLFVRISIDQIARIEDFQSMVTTGEVSR